MLTRQNDDSMSSTITPVETKKEVMLLDMGTDKNGNISAKLKFITQTSTGFFYYNPRTHMSILSEAPTHTGEVTADLTIPSKTLSKL